MCAWRMRGQIGMEKEKMETAAAEVLPDAEMVTKAKCDGMRVELGRVEERNGVEQVEREGCRKSSPAGTCQQCQDELVETENPAAGEKPEYWKLKAIKL